MTTRFFVGRVFRIALAGIILHVVCGRGGGWGRVFDAPAWRAGLIGSILHVVGRCRIGLLSELFECFTLLGELFECFSLFDEHAIAFGLLIPPELSEGGPAIDLISKSPLPPPGGRETFW
jgi:hypothetical protein